MKIFNDGLTGQYLQLTILIVLLIGYSGNVNAIGREVQRVPQSGRLIKTDDNSTEILYFGNWP